MHNVHTQSQMLRKRNRRLSNKQRHDAETVVANAACLVDVAKDAGRRVTDEFDGAHGGCNRRNGATQ